MFKVKLEIKNTERRHWHRSGIFIVNFEQIDAKDLIQEKTEKSAPSLVNIVNEKSCVSYLSWNCWKLLFFW